MSVTCKRQPERSTGRASSPGKYLTFQLGAEEYGVEVLQVREIIGYVSVTPVPRTPAHIRGVLNRRGQVVPVVDLRTRLGLPTAEPDSETCIIVTELSHGDKRVTTGMLVDRVCEILTITEDQMESPPELGALEGDDFILSMAKVGETVRILLDVERVLSVRELQGTVEEHRENQGSSEKGDGNE